MARPERLVAGVAVALAAAVAALLAGRSTGEAAAGRRLYVSPAGHDAASGSRAHPWRSLQHAADRARAGDTIVVAPGTYAAVRLTRSGRPGRPITITGPRRGAAAVVTAQGRNEVVALAGVRHVVLARLAVTGAPRQWGAGVHVARSSDVTLSRLDVHDNRSFGVEIEDASAVTLTRSRVHANETGVQVSRGGKGVRLLANDVFDNDRMIVSDRAPGNDRGANAMVFYKTSGPLLVRANRIWGNRAPSVDYGQDGGAFEIYAASGLTIRDNVAWDNQNVVETGTDGSAGCADNRFVRNVAYGPSLGLILRCAERMLVANNTLVGLSRFSFDVTAQARAFGGSIEGLRIVNNIAAGAEKLHSIDSALPASVDIDHNLLFNTAGGYLAYVAGRGNTRTLAEFTGWTGRERAGISADPLFRAPAGNDFRPRRGSPAIDAGVRVAGVTDGARGAAPDLGRFESG